MADAAIIVNLFQRWLHRRMLGEALRTTLAGLDTLHVAVEPVNEDAERDGLGHEALAAVAEEALRRTACASSTRPSCSRTCPGRRCFTSTS